MGVKVYNELPIALHKAIIKRERKSRKLLACARLYLVWPVACD